MTILGFMTSMVGVTLFLGALRFHEGRDYGHFIGMFSMALVTAIIILLGVPLR